MLYRSMLRNVTEVGAVEVVTVPALLVVVTVVPWRRESRVSQNESGAEKERGAPAHSAHPLRDGGAAHSGVEAAELVVAGEHEGERVAVAAGTHRHSTATHTWKNSRSGQGVQRQGW